MKLLFVEFFELLAQIFEPVMFIIQEYGIPGLLAEVLFLCYFLGVIVTTWIGFQVVKESVRKVGRYIIKKYRL